MEKLRRKVNPAGLARACAGLYPESVKKAETDRAARLAEALRENLRRRKVQTSVQTRAQDRAGALPTVATRRPDDAGSPE